MGLTYFHFFSRYYADYLLGKPACNLPKNLGSTNGVLFMPYMSQLVIKDMACPDVDTAIGPLTTLVQFLLCVEGVQHLVIFILGLTLPKHLEDL